MFSDFLAVTGVVLCASLIAVAALLALYVMLPRHSRAPSIFDAQDQGHMFIFDGETLLDASPAARALIAGTSPPHEEEAPAPNAWHMTLARLEPMFPGLTARVTGLEREGRFVLCSREDLLPALILRAEKLSGLTRITLLDTTGDPASRSADGMVELALRDELAQLHDMLARAPMPIWRETAEGEVIWANGPYLAAVSEVLEPGQELSWPLPQLFSRETRDLASLEEQRRTSPHGGAHIRVPSRQKDDPKPIRLAFTALGATQWYDIHCRPAPNARPHIGRLCYALPADEAVRAETTLHDFTQTLAKTFSQLPIGLAIFDKARVLQMFNPALLDLSGLPVDFLISRPNLPALLDAMREKSRLPEPKDYRTWRRQMAEMEKAAAEGLFEDTWTLPGGQTWRVTGRPHPNGALAFMIEDISNEMSRARRYRADLELGQAVVDGLSDAVIVFAQDGSVALSNTAAAELWGESPVRLTSGTQDRRAINRWRQKTAPSLLWNDLEEFIGLFGPREPLEGEIRLNDGRQLLCRANPLAHGSTLITFQLLPSSAALPPQPITTRALEQPAMMIA